MTPQQAAPGKRMRLRYTGTCRACNTEVPAGESALYFKAARQIECLRCHQSGPKPAQATAASGIDVAIQPVPIDVGVAGASARREHERRVAGRANRVRAAHPKIGGFLLAVTDEPQSTRAWAVGARGEEQLAARLDTLVARGVLVLHDVLWPAKASERITATGPLTPQQTRVVHRHLAQTFPAAYAPGPRRPDEGQPKPATSWGE